MHIDTVQRTDINQWWQDAIIYQIYPRSFNDSNSDGLGDIPGITTKLKYLYNLGIDAIWLSPHYPSPQADTGYDVADYFDVNPDYGTLADFDEMLNTAHSYGIKVIVDVVPNHCSNQMQWFLDALKAQPGSPERDRFIFRYSENCPPNNWGSMFGGSAWEPVHPHSGKKEDEHWWYLHLFAPEQPDFNWNHPEVHELFKNYFRFWLDRGVDGFRVDVAHGLVKAEGLPDDSIGEDRWGSSIESEHLSGPYWDQDPVHDIYREWRAVLDDYGRDRMLVAEAWLAPERLARYVRADEMSQSFNFDYLRADWNANKLRRAIDISLASMGSVGAPVTWVMSNHDVVRAASRFGYEPSRNTEQGIGIDDPQPDRSLGLARARAMAVFTMALPGSMYIYEGEELGLPEVTDLPDSARQDPTWLRTGYKVRGRDGCRVPIPWSSFEPNYGFSEGAPWLPQPSYWKDYAPDIQEENPESTLNLYRQGLLERKKYALGSGDFVWGDSSSADLLVVHNSGVTAVLNMGQELAQLSGTFSSVLVSSAEVTLRDGVAFIPAHCGAWLL